MTDLERTLVTQAYELLQRDCDNTHRMVATAMLGSALRVEEESAGERSITSGCDIHQGLCACGFAEAETGNGEGS